MQMPGRKYPTYQPAPPANGGSPSSPIELYRHSFTTPATGSPYTATPNTQSAYIASSQWTSGTGSFTGTLVPGSTTDYALTIPTTPIAQVSPGGYTLTLNVQSGYRLTLTSFSFSRMISSLSGHIKWRLYVNGTQVAVYTTTNTTTITSTGNYTLTSPVTGLTGAVSIQLGLQGASGDTTSFTLDNFVLNGFVQRIPTAANIGQGESNAQRYRYGFNGKEYDNEVYGDGGEQDYGMRIYDPRIGRFLSRDPIASSYPMLSTYQFASNRPICAIDLDGLEPKDVITGKDKWEFNNPDKMDRGNYMPWLDLMTYRSVNKLYNMAYERTGTPFFRQAISEAIGNKVSLDYYTAKIDKLPPAFKTAEELFKFIRVNFASFKKDGGAELSAYTKSEAEIWKSTNPLSAIMHFDAYDHGVNVEDFNVICVKSRSDNWVFETVSTFSANDGNHPLGGLRQFGIATNKESGKTDTYTFYTRGADSPWSALDVAAQDRIDQGADKLWKQVMLNVVNFINANGGSASVGRSIRTSVNWKSISQEDRNEIKKQPAGTSTRASGQW